VGEALGEIPVLGADCDYVAFFTASRKHLVGKDLLSISRREWDGLSVGLFVSFFEKA